MRIFAEGDGEGDVETTNFHSTNIKTSTPNSHGNSFSGGGINNVKTPALQLPLLTETNALGGVTLASIPGSPDISQTHLAAAGRELATASPSTPKPLTRKSKGSGFV